VVEHLVEVVEHSVEAEAIWVVEHLVEVLQEPHQANFLDLKKQFLQQNLKLLKLKLVEKN
jgi:hypothetical protein